MAKVKEARSEEFYRGQVRSLQKEIKRLKQRIKQLEKYEDFNGMSPKKIFKLKTKDLGDCPSCGKGELEEFEIANKVFDTCKLCGYRSKIKKMLKRK